MVSKNARCPWCNTAPRVWSEAGLAWAACPTLSCPLTQTFTLAEWNHRAPESRKLIVAELKEILSVDMYDSRFDMTEEGLP